MKLLLISPALNEEENIGAVVASLREELPAADILVVDDGSTDRTIEVARGAGAIVLRLPFNLGIGAAVQTGFLYALRRGYDAACQVDGDGQHPADQIKKLVELSKNSNAEVVIGSRFLAKSDYKGVWTRRLGIAILSGIISALTRRKVTDPTSGMRVVKRSALELFARDYPEDYPEPESLVILRRAGLTFEEHPVKMLRRQSGVSSIGTFGAVYYMIKVILAILITLCRKKLPPKTEAGGDEDV